MSKKVENTMSDIIRILRLLEYEGERSTVEEQVSKSIHGTRMFQLKHNGPIRITAVTLGTYPEVIEPDRRIACPDDLLDMYSTNQKLVDEVAELKAIISGLEDQVTEIRRAAKEARGEKE